MGAIHYHVRSEGHIIKRALCIAFGIDMKGRKDVLGMDADENESGKFRFSIMNGLKSFPQAIETVYLQNEVQQCMIHQIRN